MTERERNIVEKAKKVEEWLREMGWEDAKRCPDPIAASYGFNDILMDLCDAVNEDSVINQLPYIP